MLKVEISTLAVGTDLVSPEKRDVTESGVTHLPSDVRPNAPQKKNAIGLRVSVINC